MKDYAVGFFLLALSAVLYLSNLSAAPYLKPLYSFLSSLVHPLLEVKGKIVEATREGISTYIAFKNLSEENKRLKYELELYKLYKTQLDTCTKNLESVGAFTGLSFDIRDYPSLFARVIAYDSSGRGSYLLIDRGRDSDISEGFLVAHGEHLVGIVDRVFSGSSRVRTVYSEEFSVSSGVGDRAYIYKGGFPEGKLLHVRSEEGLKEGDEVFLRPPGKDLPHLKIGRVRLIGYGGEGFFKDVSVSPFLDVKRVSVVLIIKERL
ncbi:MAG: rod shape-determining protein MreC [Acidobacteria bacterium]|jgi:rod shape-determining protein MreC|nr:MAG: rod shape-determining protein MreC [Acidobacteriota bacterium]